MNKKQAAAELLRRKQATEGLLDFTRYTHPNWSTGPHHERICEALDRVIRGELKRLMIFAPPRGSKSETATRRMPAMFLGKHPDKQIITACYGDDLANDMGRDVRDIIREPIYKNVFPNVHLSADTRAAGRWRTNEGGIYVSCGLGGPVVGRGFHIGIIDDPHKGRKEADSPRQRDDAWHWYWGNFYTRRMPDLEEGAGWGSAAIALMLTRWHEDDLAGRLLEHEGRKDEGGEWEVIEIEAIENEDTPDEVSFWPDGFPLDTELWPTREKMRRAGRAREWSAQYQQKPVPEEGTYCKRAWFEKRWVNGISNIPTQMPLPETAAMKVYIWSDYAVTDEADGNDPDYTEHGVFGIPHTGELFVLDWWYGRTDSDVWIEELLDLAEKWTPNTVFGEKGQIIKSVGPYLKRRMRKRKVRFKLDTVASVRDKASRGRVFQAMASMGDIIFPAHEPWAERIIEQCVGFPAVRYDDAFDVMSGMCLTIDKAPANVSLSHKPPKRRDRWQTTPERTGWKTI